MDTGNGNFTELQEEQVDAYREGTFEKPEGAGGIFSVEEKLEIRGSKFRVRKITHKDLILRLLPKGD